MKWLILLILVLWGCITSNTTSYTTTQTIYVDGCYYLVTEAGGICHKANCSNLVHKEGN